MNILACDLGGTRMKIGIVRDERVLARVVKPACSHRGLARRLPVLKSAWMELLDKVELCPDDCAGISISFPSVVDTAAGRGLAGCGKFMDAPEMDLRAWAREEFGLPLAIENDARMALVGEWRAGAGRGIDNLAMITLGTGLGSAAIMEGRVVRGKHGQAAVLGGHLTVSTDGPLCNCGNIGCAEAQASTAHLCDMVVGMRAFDFSPLRKAATLNYASIFKHAAAGDPCALALRDHSLNVWGAMAVSLIHAYDPEMLILGGGIMRSAEVIVPAIRSYVERYAFTPWGKVCVVSSALGDQAALVAGEWLLREQRIGTRKRDR